MPGRMRTAHGGGASSDDMKVYIGAQAEALAWALLMGAGLGLAYDMLRPIRYSAGKTGAVAVDVLYSACTMAAVFCFSMRSESGSLGTWELFMILAGFLLYLQTLSDTIIRAELYMRKKTDIIKNWIKERAKKLWLFVILLFQKRKE